MYCFLTTKNNFVFLSLPPDPPFSESVSQRPQRADDDGDRIHSPRVRVHPVAVRVHTPRRGQGHRQQGQGYHCQPSGRNMR